MKQENPDYDPTQDTAVPIPPLVWKSWWIYCLPAVLGIGSLFGGPENFAAKVGSGLSWHANVAWTMLFPMGIFASLVICWGRYRWLCSWLARCEGCMCAICGYDLHMAGDAGNCPECSHPYQRAETIAAWTTWKAIAFCSSKNKLRFSYMAFFGFRIRTKEFFVLIVVCLIANYTVSRLLVDPANVEVTRAQDADTVARNASYKAKQEWYQVMKPNSGATDEQRKAVDSATDATAEAEREASGRLHEAYEAHSRAHAWYMGGSALVFVGGACVVLRRYFRLKDRVTH